MMPLKSESKAPHDIFLRWKPLEAQPVGRSPNFNEDVRLNIRHFMSVPDAGRKGAGVLRDKPQHQLEQGPGRGPRAVASPVLGRQD